MLFNIVLQNVCRSVPLLICRRIPSSHKTGREVSRHASQAKCLVIKSDKKCLTIYNNQHAGTIPARQLWPFGVVGKAGAPVEKPPQACTEQANRVDITKHKCRDIGLTDGMGVPNRQANQRGRVLGYYLFRYTVSLLVKL